MWALHRRTKENWAEIRSGNLRRRRWPVDNYSVQFVHRRCTVYAAVTRPFSPRLRSRRAWMDEPTSSRSQLLRLWIWKATRYTGKYQLQVKCRFMLLIKGNGTCDIVSYLPAPAWSLSRARSRRSKPRLDRRCREEMARFEIEVAAVRLEWWCCY